MTKKAVLFDQKKRIIGVNRSPSLCVISKGFFSFTLMKIIVVQKKIFFSHVQCSSSGGEYLLYRVTRPSVQ